MRGETRECPQRMTTCRKGYNLTCQGFVADLLKQVPCTEVAEKAQDWLRTVMDIGRCGRACFRRSQAHVEDSHGYRQVWAHLFPTKPNA